MSTKRTSAAEETTDGSDSENVKRANLVSVGETTLQDLPIELLEDILIKVVLVEVKAMRLVKRLWKERAVHVISRLGTVCSIWSYIAKTDFFRKKVNRILDETGEDAIRFDTVQQTPPIMNLAVNVTTMRDEAFVLCRQGCRDYLINVYDCGDLKAVKNVVPLSRRNPLSLASCNVSNCVYLLNREERCQGSVLRIARDAADQQFKVSYLFSDMWLPCPALSVTAAGDLVISRQRYGNRAAIHIYDTTGSVLREIRLSSEILEISHIFPKPNGNLVLVSSQWGHYPFTRRLTEVDVHGNTLREFVHSAIEGSNVCPVDMHGRILIMQQIPDRTLLLDPEFNPLKFAPPKLDFPYARLLRYNYERKEILTLSVGGHIAVVRIVEE